MATRNGQKRRDLLIRALACGESIAAAARISGWSERTIRRRMALPEFQRQVADVRSKMVTDAAGRLASAMSEAVVTLRHLLTAEGESVRLGAARSILETGLRVRESVDLESRLAALEARINERTQTPVDASRARFASNGRR